MMEQEAIIRLTKEIDILNKAPVHVNKLHDVEIAVEARETAISALEEIQQYRALGTVEELREARERQVPKKISIVPSIEKEIKNGVYVFYKCPECGNKITSGFYYPPYNEFLKSHKFCEDCGQAIDWSDTK